MPMHGGRIVARALKQENVPYVFTLCGGPVMSNYHRRLAHGTSGVARGAADRRAGPGAAAGGRAPGQPGGAIAPAGPGLTDAVTGVATAWRANIPLVVIGGQAPRLFQDMGGLQDMNHVDLMRPIT